MHSFSQSAVGVTQGTCLMFSAFEDGGEMWAGQGPRVARQRVTFERAFLATPLVHVAIGMWDIAGSSNQRADISAEKITAEEFEIVFRTWGDTRVARIRAQWLAIGPLRHEDDFSL